MNVPFPFRYPSSVQTRLHGPSGYADYRNYRPWLRDEFWFRCVYCLTREAWGLVLGAFDLDHFKPQALHPDLVVQYDNLVYSCHGCNLLKGKSLLPVPSAASLRVEDDGRIVALDDDGTRLIDLLGLDDDRYTRFRAKIIRLIRAIAHSERDLIDWMGFPVDDLPDLERLNPPHNSRPEGLSACCFALHRIGVLPTLYE
jgi:5-methylcytosine-specific restriction endonuclease McrA